MSSISAQLSSLHSKGGSSSHQHSDAVGRGIHHSTKAGRTILSNNVKNKPSVLYPDSRAAAAADVPFTTLRENAVASLQFLYQYASPVFDISGDTLPWRTIFGPKSVKYERGLNSKETNAKFDGMVKDALYLLSTAWGDSMHTLNASSSSFIQLGASKPSSVLHALEYLIQKYYVHVYNAEDLLVSFLPYHETFLFDRILQLVDLAQYPHWSFLRPFSAAKGMKGVPRTVIAKWAASTKDNGGGIVIIKKICELSKKAAKIHSHETKLGVDYNEIRQGISISISFAASTLAETIHIQNATTGSIDEQVVRTMIPTILNTLEPSRKNKNWSLGALCPEWRAFGHVLLSLLVDNCDLNLDVSNTLSGAILKGCQESIQLLIHDDCLSRGEEYDRSTKIIELGLSDKTLSSIKESVYKTSSDAILSIMVLSQGLNDVEKDENKLNCDYLLPIVRKDSKEHGHVIENDGCKLTLKMFHALMDIPYLVPAIGHLYAEKNIDVRTLIASICTMSISTKFLKTSDFKHDGNIIIELAKDEILHSVWLEEGMVLVKSLSSYVINYAANLSLNKKDRQVIHGSISDILKAMKSIHPSSCDVGITYAIKMNSKLIHRDKIHELLLLSGHVTETNNSKDVKERKGSKSGINNELEELLPPMMALEHPNTAVRLRALSNIRQQLDESTNPTDIALALLRRFITDDDELVASKAIELLKLLSSIGKLSEFFNQTQIAKDVIYGLNKWTLLHDQNSKLGENGVQILSSSLGISAICSMEIIQGMSNGPMYDNDMMEIVSELVKGISQHINFYKSDQNKNWEIVGDKALNSLRLALGEESLILDKSELTLDKICENKVFKTIVQICVDQSSSKEEPRQFLLCFLHLWRKVSTQGKTATKACTNDAVGRTIVTLLSYGKESNQEEINFLSDCLNKVLPTIQDEISQIHLISDLFAISSKKLFEDISPTIQSFILKHGSVLLLLEAMTRRNVPTNAVERMMFFIDEIINTQKYKEKETYSIAVLSYLCMCGHSEVNTRRSALNLFDKTFASFAKKDAKVRSLKVTSLANTPTQMNTLMDGGNALPEVLRALGGQNHFIAQFFLASCESIARRGLNAYFKDKAENNGFCDAASVILSAMETAGENNFPLSNRWKVVGKPLFDLFVKKLPQTSASLAPSVKTLLENVIVMLKGVTIESESEDRNIIITSHVTRLGTRSRSYSVGMSEGISFMKSYPKDMSQTLLKALSMCTEKEMTPCLNEFFEVMIDLVLRRSSWVNGVFKKLDMSERKAFSVSLLNLRAKTNIESASMVIFGLNLNCEELLHLISSKESTGNRADSIGLLALTIVTEYTRQHSDSLQKDEHIFEFISALFDKLTVFSRNDDSEFTDGCDYTRCSIIQALVQLTNNMTANKKITEEISCHSKLVVTLLQYTGEKQQLRPLISGKSRSLALQLLTNLCALSPANVVGSLVPAMTSTLTQTSSGLKHTNNVESAMMAIIPSYCTHASSSGLSLLDLLNALLEHCNSAKDELSWSHKQSLCSSITKALLTCTQSKASKGCAIASLLTVFLANEAVNDWEKQKTEESSLKLTFLLLGQMEVDEQIASSLPMLTYIIHLLQKLIDEDEMSLNEFEMKSDFFFVHPKDIISLLGSSKNSSKNQQVKISTMWLISTLMDVLFKNIFSQPLVKRSIRYSDDGQAGICLSLWQELTALQSLVSHCMHKDTAEGQSNVMNRWWTKVDGDVRNVLSIVQKMLPTPHFLASVTSIINDNSSNVELKARAVQLLAERTSDMDTSSPEATLFLEMIPDLVELTKSRSRNGANNYEKEILRCSSLQSIETLAKNLGLSCENDKIRRKRSTLFLPAFQSIASFLRNQSNNLASIKEGNQNNSDTNLPSNLQQQSFCSAAMCAATLIILLEAKCVPYLQALVNPMISTVTIANNLSIQMKNRDNVDTEIQSLRLLQLAVLRTLIAVAEKIPQFFVPYVETLLGPSCLPSIKLINDLSDEGKDVVNMAQRLEDTIATRSPAHQLIPSLSRSMKKCVKSNSDIGWQSALSILRILNMCISQSSRATLGPQVGKILNALVQAYSYEDNNGKSELLKETNETLLSMVMKLSESQLRPLYTKLREWRGEFNSTNCGKSQTCKRYAFWSLSAAICSRLKNIFLPCMSSVVGDMAKELEFAASSLCTSIEESGNKRRKMNGTQELCADTEILSPLQPLLLCLEYTFKADAHDGGNWVRSEDGQRFRTLLSPLGRLLQAKVSSQFHITSDLAEDRRTISRYQMLVEGIGTEEHGNVSQTIAALAAAAGNEQLWKPLNYSLLEACGHEKRAEVRRAGVKTLLNIIQTLGEEYMVLLPECLPVLSELLEDEDEEIIALAKECVRQGEELLGESLEDSLR